MSSGWASFYHKNLKAYIPIDHYETVKLNHNTNTIVFPADINWSHWVAWSVNVDEEVLLAILFNSLDRIGNQSGIIWGLSKMIDIIIVCNSIATLWHEVKWGWVKVVKAKTTQQLNLDNYKVFIIRSYVSLL